MRAPTQGGNRTLRAILLAGLLLVLAACGDAPAGAAGGGGEHAAAPPNAAAPLLKGWRVRQRPPNRPREGERREIVVVATSDLHGWITSATLYPKGRPGGLAHLAPLIAELRAETPDLILLDAGDTLRGAPNLSLPARFLPEMSLPARGAGPAPPPILRLMNRLGYDAMALGNHDLEAGRTALARWVGQSEFPWLSANVRHPERETLLPPYRIIERGGVRVAVLGLITPGVAIWLDRKHLAGLRVQDMAGAARRWLPVLREVERADVVIGLFHSGLDGWYDRAVALRHGLPLPNAAGLIAEGRAGFDLIVSGHAHRLSPRRSRNGNSAYAVPVVQPGARGEGLAVARLMLRGVGGRWQTVAVRRETRRAAIRPAPALLAEVEPELAATRVWLAEATGVRFSSFPDKIAFHRCAGELSHQAASRLAPGTLSAPADGAPELGRAAASLLPMMWRFVPPRPAELGAPLRRAHLHRWMRYGNMLVLARLNVRQVALLLGPFARRKGGLRTRYSAVLYPGGLRARIASGGTEVLALALPGGGGPLSSHATIPVWLTNYHWNGGSGLARRALLHPSQIAGRTRVSLRELVFRLLSDPAMELPPGCRSFLEKDRAR